jgi:hypothetical protein
MVYRLLIHTLPPSSDGYQAGNGSSWIFSGGLSIEKQSGVSPYATQHEDVPQRPIAPTMQGIIVDRVAIVCHNLLPS